MPTGGIAVKGLKELQSAVKRSGDEGLKKALITANKSAAELVVDIATPNTPRRHGDLVHSLRALASQASGRARAGSGSVAYAAAIHWGRKQGNVGRPPGNRNAPNRIRGVPFLWNAARSNQTRIAVEYRKAIDRDVVAPMDNKG